MTTEKENIMSLTTTQRDIKSFKRDAILRITMPDKQPVTCRPVKYDNTWRLQDTKDLTIYYDFGFCQNINDLRDAMLKAYEAGHILRVIITN